MRFSKWQFRLPAACLLIMLSLLGIAGPGSATTRKPAAKPQPLGLDYGAALAAANHFLEAWRIADLEIGMSLLSARAREKTPEPQIETFFSGPEPGSYEIGRGKLVRAGCYEFPVVLVRPPAGGHLVRRSSTLVVVKTGNNEWLVDQLP